MFDALVESSRHGRENSRTGLFMFITTAIYAVVLVGVTVGTIIYMNPELAGALDVQAMIAPPPPPPAPPPPAAQVVITNLPAQTYVFPIKPPERIPNRITIVRRPVVAVFWGVPGGVPGGVRGGVPGAGSGGEDPPPPPPPPPPTPAPTAPPKK